MSNIETEFLKNYDNNRILQDVVSDHVHRTDSPSLTLILDTLIQLILHGMVFKGMTTNLNFLII
ncbi:hypothetical protein RHMOL_Rhmol03G0174000 [Rhododendron molle]|uniref:Uncharacterized protein n=1 Tax=Rhododendron molle TaxID=49168 RepID=A0ACC0PFB2_RHOML|nr:hypothetical protein RHMOL_Rhmol03G0174000 [Rhododendron molle]